MKFRSLLIIAAIAAAGSVHAHDYQLKDLRIDHPYARSTAPQQPSGAAYLTIENRGTSGDKLVAASSPIAKSVQIHTMSMDGNVMRMREVDAVDLEPKSKLEMMPGSGYHMMLIGLRHPLKAGDKFPLTLTFEKAGATEVSVTVEDKAKSDMGSKGGMSGMQHGH